MHSFAQQNNLFLALPLSLAFVDVWSRVGKGKLYLLLLSGVYLHVCHGGMKCRHCEQLPPRVFLLVAPLWQTARRTGRMSDTQGAAPPRVCVCAGCVCHRRCEGCVNAKMAHSSM